MQYTFNLNVENEIPSADQIKSLIKQHTNYGWKFVKVVYSGKEPQQIIFEWNHETEPTYPPVS